LRGQQRRPKRRRLDELRPHDRRAQEIGLELHEQIVPAGAAVHTHLGEGHAQVVGHGAEHVVHLEGDALERGAGEVSLRGAPVEPADEPARRHIPVRRAETR
jgi:hypothetical protein